MLRGWHTNVIKISLPNITESIFANAADNARINDVSFSFNESTPSIIFIDIPVRRKYNQTTAGKWWTKIIIYFERGRLLCYKII